MKEPGYLRNRVKGRADRAFVILGGRRTYLGAFGSPESRRKYHRLCLEWRSGAQAASAPPDDLTVAELLDAYLKHAEGYYRRADGTSSSELANMRLAMPWDALLLCPILHDGTKGMCLRGADASGFPGAPFLEGPWQPPEASRAAADTPGSLG